MTGLFVSVAQMKGGVGKSTLTAQLAVACAARGYKSKIVDIDRQASLLAWADLRDQLTLKIVKEVSVEQGSGWRLPYISARLLDECDLLFVDGASGRDDDFVAMTEIADLVLIPCQPTALDLWATKTLLASNPGLRSKALVVLNRMPPRGKAATLIRQELVKLAWPMARHHLGNRQAYAATLGAGLGVAEVASASMAGQEISALAAEIIERLDGVQLVA